MITSTKYLSVRHLWAWAIIKGLKPVENRDWPTDFRGRLFIHMGQSLEGFEAASIFMRKQGILPPSPQELPLGCIIGNVEITDCVTRMRSPWFFGEFGFKLADPVSLDKPVFMKANTGLRELPPEILPSLPLEWVRE